MARRGVKEQNHCQEHIQRNAGSHAGCATAITHADRVARGWLPGMFPNSELKQAAGATVSSALMSSVLVWRPPWSGLVLSSKLALTGIKGDHPDPPASALQPASGQQHLCYDKRGGRDSSMQQSSGAACPSQPRWRLVGKPEVHNSSSTRNSHAAVSVPVDVRLWRPTFTGR
jgi:hypothetical protein